MDTENLKECGCRADYDPFAYDLDRTESFTKTPQLMIVDKEPDYAEHYIDQIYNDWDSDDDLDRKQSTTSLPEVQVVTDRCEGRIEIPWLEFSLPPPGTLQIVTKKPKIFGKKGPCQCWRNKKDIIEQEKEKRVQVPDDIGVCKCTSTDKAAIRRRKAEGDSDQPKTDGEEPPPEEAPPEEAPPEEAPQDEGSPDEAPPDEAPPEEAAPEEEAPPEDAPPEDAPPDEAPPEDAPPEEGSPDEAPPEEGDEADQPTDEAPEAEKPPDEGEKPPEEPTKQEELEDEDYVFPFKPCLCIKDDAECSELKAIRMTYDNPCFASHEPYMDLLYKRFPDDCDTECGPYTEIPWDEIVIPRNIKLKGAIRKKPKACDATTCPKRSGNFDDPNDPNTMALVKVDKYGREVVQCKNREPQSFVGDDNIMGQQFQNGEKPATCACFETGKRSKRGSSSVSPKMPSRNGSKQNACKCSAKGSGADRKLSSKGASSKGAEIMKALYNCQAEMEPIKTALIDLKSKISTLKQLNTSKMSDNKGDIQASNIPSNVTSKNTLCNCLPPPMLPPLPSFPPPPFPIPPFLPPMPNVPGMPSIPSDFVCSNKLNKSPLSTSPCTLKCAKCKRSKMVTRKESSSTSENSKLKKKDKKSTKDKDLVANDKDSSKKKKRNCKCAGRLAEKMTNTRRRDCLKSCAKYGNKDSCPSATSGGIIIEECQ